ncbi:hypothetical protein [Paraburkholderia humisilvae]|uniref:Lipoprotein n=1 Tax=Paraburkholderia humisilvae TaxID=627669 RepID=A0A6J5F5U0_9BURK|nr:hypothetical protein [Paraburkholderia humisilvae]CAB3773884.1 hypothetical protein LMG29542_07482 [Paraburkholderia humisilvae]
MCSNRHRSLFLILVTAALALVSGCANTPVTDVAAVGALPSDNDGGAIGVDRKTFSFGQTSVAIPPEVLTGITRGLVERGWRSTSPQTARYRVDVAYATRPSNVEVIGRCDGMKLCDADSLGSQKEGSRAVRHRFVHTLAIRFVDVKKREWAYKVICKTYDDDPDPDKAGALVVNKALGAF